MKLLSALFSMFVLAMCGCSPTTHTVSGTVKYAGEPLAEGNIAFIGEGSGASGVGPIADGSYKVAVPPGKMKIQITATKMVRLPVGEKSMYGKSEEIRQYIPANYNANTELNADITGPKTNLDFDLKSSTKAK
jgi:hypothetical protein